MRKTLVAACMTILASCLLLFAQARTALGQADNLVAHWPLAENARDLGPHGLYLDVEQVEFGAVEGRAAAQFDGRTSLLVKADPALSALVAGDYSASLWVYTDAQLADAPGDWISLQDEQLRNGWSLGSVPATGVTSSEPNLGQLVFGVYGEADEPQWTDCGRPANAILIFSLCVHEGRLFAGTCEAESERAGHVFVYEGDGQWCDLGAPDRCNSVTSLAVHEGELYAGVSKYRLAGSGLVESENPNLGGAIYRWDGESSWILCGRLPDVEAIACLAHYRGDLYATSLYKPGGLFRYAGGDSWESCGLPNEKRVEALAVHNSLLYATSYDGGDVYTYDGTSWKHEAKLEENTQTYAFAVYNGQLHSATWPSGKVYRQDAPGQWSDTGRLGEELEVMPMFPYNGSLYAGTLPLAQVYRYNGLPGSWTLLKQLDTTPDVKYRRVWSMALHEGQLYCGTLPSGHVHALRVGDCTSTGRPLSAGWQHVAAVRQADRLQIYINGELASETAAARQTPLNLGEFPVLVIGGGPHDYFAGALSEVRLYDCALTAAQITALAQE